AIRRAPPGPASIAALEGGGAVLADPPPPAALTRDELPNRLVEIGDGRAGADVAAWSIPPRPRTTKPAVPRRHIRRAAFVSRHVGRRHAQGSDGRRPGARPSPPRRGRAG